MIRPSTILCLAVLCWPLGESRADPVRLNIALGNGERSFAPSELLARPDAVEVAVPKDASYGGATRYRAVPLLALLGPAQLDSIDTIEARATDGFVSQIPLALIRRGAEGGAVAWIAVEDALHPWPKLPGKAATAGPFYLIWDHPERSGVTSEQWPYGILSLTGVESPVHRWPQIAVPDALPADVPARHGQAVFIAQCMPCHRMHGGGGAEVGPDLGQPVPAARYLTEAGLRALIRNPRAVRTWPEQRMTGFDVTVLSDDDLTAVIAYLVAMAGQGSAAAR